MTRKLFGEDKIISKEQKFKFHRNISIVGFVLMLLPVVDVFLTHYNKSVQIWTRNHFFVYTKMEMLLFLLLLLGTFTVGFFMFIHFIIIKNNQKPKL